MPPHTQDPDRDDAPSGDPEAPEGARGSRASVRGSRKRRRDRRKRSRHRKKTAKPAEEEVAKGAKESATRAGSENVLGSDSDADPASTAVPGSTDASRLVSDVSRPAEPDEATLKRRLRVAAYTHPADAPHSPEELESVADLARELAQLSTPETRSRLLAEAVAHAEAKEARYRVPMKEPGSELRWKAPLALTILTAAALAAVAPPTWVVPDPPAQLDASDRLHGIRLTLLLQAQQVEAFRAREQRLPESLDDVAVRFSGVRFVRSNSRVYQLVGYTPRGEAVVYDPAHPGPDFERLGASWSLSLHALQAQQP